MEDSVHSTSLDACIDRPGVDAVILTTPSDQHADQTVLALSKGKHVQVEIPMALNLADSERMLAASKAAGKTLMVTHTRRFSSPHREIKRRIREGTFHLHHMVVETYFFRRTNLNMHGQPRSWVDNLLWHHGCHSVDIAQWILDDPNWDVWGQKGPNHPELGIPMDLTVAMKSRQGPLFSMAMSFNNKGPFGGFYRYIGEEDTYKVYRDSMTDSDGQGRAARRRCPPSIGRTSSSSARFAKAASRNRARRAACRRWRCSTGSIGPWRRSRAEGVG